MFYCLRLCSASTPASSQGLTQGRARKSTSSPASSPPLPPKQQQPANPPTHVPGSPPPKAVHERHRTGVRPSNHPLPSLTLAAQDAAAEELAGQPRQGGALSIEACTVAVPSRRGAPGVPGGWTTIIKPRGHRLRGLRCRPRACMHTLLLHAWMIRLHASGHAGPASRVPPGAAVGGVRDQVGPHLRLGLDDQPGGRSCLSVCLSAAPPALVLVLPMACGHLGPAAAGPDAPMIILPRRRRGVPHRGRSTSSCRPREFELLPIPPTHTARR